MKHFEVEIKVVLRELNSDGSNTEIVGVGRTESFTGKSEEFKEHYEMVSYKVDNHLSREFDKAFPEPIPDQKLPEIRLPSPTLVDDEIPF